MNTDLDVWYHIDKVVRFKFQQQRKNGGLDFKFLGPRTILWQSESRCMGNKTNCGHLNDDLNQTEHL